MRASRAFTSRAASRSNIHGSSNEEDEAEEEPSTRKQQQQQQQAIGGDGRIQAATKLPARKSQPAPPPALATAPSPVPALPSLLSPSLLRSPPLSSSASSLSSSSASQASTSPSSRPSPLSNSLHSFEKGRPGLVASPQSAHTQLNKSPREVQEENMLLLPPQPAFLGRRSSSSGYKSNNASTTSFVSSSAGDDDMTPPHSGRDSEGSWEHVQNNVIGDAAGRDGARSTKRGFSFEDKPRSTARDNGGFKSLGRRLFNRSAVIPARSESQSSAASAQSSPPLTPTTTPRLPSFQKGIDGLPILPPLSVMTTTQAHQSFAGSMLEQRGNFAGSAASSASTTSSIPALSHDSSATSSSLSSLGLPLLPPATATASKAKKAPMTTMTERVESPTRTSPPISPTGMPRSRSSQQVVVTSEPTEDSDFLRAVLNFGFSDEEQDDVPSLPTRSSSRFGGLAGGGAASTATGSQYSPFALGSLPSWTARRQGEAPKRLTEAEARAMAEEERQSKSTQPYGYSGGFSERRQYRAGLFGRNVTSQDDDSEDEYGDDGDDAESSEDEKGTVAKAPFPSSFAKAPKRHSGSSSAGADHRTSSPVKQPQGPSGPGLDTGAKKAIYTCTLLKVHPQLASCVKVSPDGQLAPGAAKIAEMQDNAALRDVRFPRSINRPSHLASHSSTTSFTRDLRVAVHRSHVMKKLKKTVLPVHEEVELGWFVTKYGSQLISPEEIAARLAQRPAASPEALARPPMAVPLASASPATPSSPLARRDSLDSIVGESIVEHNGMALWSSRPGFVDRTVIVADEEYHPGEIVLPLADMSFTVGKRASVVAATTPGQAFTVKKTARPGPITFSKRTQVLAGLAAEIDLAAPKGTKLVGPPRQRERPPRQSTMPNSTSTYGLPRDRSVAPWMAGSRPPQPWRTSTMPTPRQSQMASGVDFGETNLPVLSSSASVATLKPPEESDRAAALRKLSGSTSLAALHQRASTDSVTTATNTASKRDLRAAASYSGHGIAEEDENERSSDEEEEVPLAMLRSHRAERSAERERMARLEAEVMQLREREREMEAVMRKEVERRKADKLLEERKRTLAEARTRRAKTEHSALLSSPTYGAGSPLSPSPVGPGMMRKSSTTHLEAPNSPPSLNKKQSSKHVSSLAPPSPNESRPSQMPSPRQSFYASGFPQQPHQLMNSMSMGNLHQHPSSPGSALGVGGMDPRASMMLHPHHSQFFHQQQQQQQQHQMGSMMQAPPSPLVPQTLLNQHPHFVQQQQQQQMMMMPSPYLHHSMSMANIRPGPQPLVQLGPGQIPSSATQHRLASPRR